LDTGPQVSGVGFQVSVVKKQEPAWDPTPETYASWRLSHAR